MGSKEIEIKNDTAFLGQPKGMAVTSFMAFAHAFGNYAMTAILIYYLYETAANGGLGFSQTNAAQLVNVYNSLSFMAGIVGGYIADRFLGIRKALYLGYGIKTIGFFLLAIPGGGVPLYLLSQFMLLMASASMGTSLYAMAGLLYSKQDKRRDTGFSFMYIFNNVGAVAPIISGTIASILNYNAGFLAAAVVQGLGLLMYVLSANKVFGDLGKKPSDPIAPKEKTAKLLKMGWVLVVALAIIGLLFYLGILTATSFSNAVSTVSIFIPLAYLAVIISSKKTTQRESVQVRGFLWIFICNCFAMLVWYQSTSILAIYAAERVDLNIFGFSFTPAAFQTVPAVLAVIFGSLSSSLWQKMGDRQPVTPLKGGIGTVFFGLAPLFMVIPFLLFEPDVKVSPLWLIVFYCLMIWGEALTSPIGMASASMVAPKAFTAQMVTVWQLSQSTGAGLSALASNFYKAGHESSYFAVIGSITAAVGLLLCIFHKKVNRQMEKGIN